MKNQKLIKDMHTLLLSVAGFLFLQLIPNALFAAPGDVLFNDDFERVALGADWTVDNGGGGDAGIGAYTANSGSRSLYTRWQVISVTSKSFDLSAVSGAQLELWARRGDDAFSEDPEDAGSEDLVVEYLNDAASWQQLTRYPGGNPAGQIFTPTFYLPADALHAGFQIRFRQTGGDGSDWDYWHVDDVVLTETTGLPTLAFPFCDDFESGTTNWQILTAGGDAGTGTHTANSASNSLYLRWGNVGVTSHNIDLSVVPAAYLNFWLRRGQDSFSEDPDNNEDFTVEYFNSSGIWASLETFNGNGQPGEIFNRNYALPADAMHSGFKIRFSMTGNDGSDWDYWHVDDVCVAGPPAPPSALAAYSFDEASWGPVTDSSGNGNDGSVVGGVTPNDVSPAIVGNPGTCGYADIPYNNSDNLYDAIDTGLDVDSDIGSVGSIDFWYKSNVRWNGGNGDRQLLDASTTASGRKYFYLTLQNNSRLSFGLEDSNDRDFVVEGSNNNFGAGVWVHIAITWDLPNDRLQVYVNGNLDDEQTFSTNGVLGNVDTLYLGDNRSTYQVGDMTGNSANGSIDEARVYNSVLSQAEIQADMNATHPCGSLLDHFVVSHDGLGINCLAEPITVTAKLADGSDYTDYTGSIVLDTQSADGNWMLGAGNGTFADATADDGQATYTFVAADNGVAMFDLNYQTGTPSIDVDAYDGAIRDDDTEGDLVFSPSGFTVTSTALSNPPPAIIDTSIPAQIAAKDFQLYLAAYGQTPTDPTCGIIESYAGAKNLKFWSTYNNPATGTLQVAVNGGNVATSEGASAAQTVNFTNGQASITVNYPDAGQITLAMKDDTVTTDLPAGIRGASQPISVVPAGLCIESTDLNADCAAGDETCSPFVAAGQAFNLSVKAVAWEMGGDTDFCAGNATTPNFRLSNIAVSHTLIVPAAGNTGTLGVTSFDMLAADNGDSTISQTISEVGVFSFNATPPLYFGETIAVGASANVGRFYPAYFDISLNNSPDFATACGSFTYMGQPFAYNTQPSVSISARAVGGSTTTNYDNNWWTLPGNFTKNYSHNGAISAGVTLSPGSALETVSCANCAGSITNNFSNSFSYTAATPETDPFIAAVDISFTLPVDADGVCYDGTGNLCNGAPQAFTISAIGFDSGAEQRSGRGFAQDVYGTFARNGDVLTMPVGSEYYWLANGGWIANPADSCSQYSYTNVDNGVSTSITPATDVTLTAGRGDLDIQLTANSTGGASTVTFGWDSWLNGTASATATFGIFRGNDRYLYWREAP